MRDFLSLYSINLKRIHAISLPQITPPNAISLHLGYPDPMVFPYEGMIKSAEKVLKSNINSLQYCEEIGDLDLRKCIFEKIYKNKNKVNENCIIITQGTTDALELFLKLFIRADDCILTEAPSYLWALRVFKMANAQISAVPIDSEGIIIELLEKRLIGERKEKKRIKFIYVIPDFQNPSSVTMSLARRESLIEIANANNILIFEDTPYYDLRYSGNSIPTLFDLDKYGIVIQARTFSKTIGPGIRLGWIVGPENIISALSKMKQTGSCTLTSKIVANFMTSAEYENNIELMRKYYGKKCSVIVSAMKECFPEDVSWFSPEGGFYVWIKVPYCYPINKLYDKAARNGVLFLKGADFFIKEKSNNDIRLSFSYESPARIRKGIKKLAEELKKSIKCK